MLKCISMKPYHINKKQILIMGCLGMFPLFSSAQDILSTSDTSRWDYSNSRVEREPGRDALDITFSVSPLAGLGSQEVAYLFPVYVSADGVTVSASNRSAWLARKDTR